MSFNKRNYNIEMLRNIYKRDGINEIIRNFNYIDAYVFNDEESSRVHEYLIETKQFAKAIKLLETMCRATFERSNRKPSKLSFLRYRLP